MILISAFTRLVCPLIFCTVFIACGKKVTQQGQEEVRTPAATTNVVELSNYESSPSVFSFPELGEAYIPENLKFEGGYTEAQTKLYFSYGNTEEEFYCLYGFMSETDYSLINCYYQDLPMNYRGGQKVHQSAGHQMRIETSPARVSAEIEIDWH